MSLFHRLSFISSSHEVGDIYTFHFKKPAGFNFTAGRHGIFLLPGLVRPHPFSFSSAPEESELAITTHTASASSFKRKLQAMKLGDAIYMVGPIMQFTLRPDAKGHVLLAQGIGITPFRSMLVHAHQAALADTIRLIHVDAGTHLFRSLTGTYASTAQYPDNSATFRDLVRQQDAAQTFYLSGSPKFISATKQLLRGQGVPSARIISDYFWGY